MALHFLWQIKRISFFLLFIFLLPACTQREFTLKTIPEGAICEVNGRYLGQTPVVVKYVDKGAFRLHLKKEGFQAFNGSFKIKTRWFNVIGLDFIADSLPYTFSDKQTVTFSLHYKDKLTHEQFKEENETKFHNNR